MKIPLVSLAASIRPLLIAALASCVLMPAWAADAMKTTMVALSGVTAAPAPAGSAEVVVFSGQVTVKTRLALDTDFGESKLVLFIDMSGVSGVGSASGASYMVRSQDVLIRPLATSQQLELTFPFFKSMSDTLASTRTGMAQIALNVDTTTGMVTSAAATMVSR
jgi:hypothetical protein